MAYTTEKKLTLSEWLTHQGIEMEHNKVIGLSGKVAQAFRDRYPGETLKKTYRPNSKGKHVSVGYGYDDRVLDILQDFLGV